MKSDRRNYPAGTREVLFMLSRGQCYGPDCGARVMRCIDGRWRTNAHIAHICGLNETWRRRPGKKVHQVQQTKASGVSDGLHAYGELTF
jgi:hypothetical protein